MLIRFLNVQIEIGWADWSHAWGLVVCWDCVPDAGSGELRYRRRFSVLWPLEVFEDNAFPVQWAPMAWMAHETHGPLFGAFDCGPDAKGPLFRSADWTGRTHYMRRIAWPSIGRW